MVARRRGTVLAGAAAAAALLVVALAGSAPAGQALPRSTAVGVGAREYRLSAYRASVPRGVVRFNLTNYGEDPHNLVVLDARGRQLASSGKVASGRQATVRVRLAPGTYRLICNLSGHARRGMRATIRVTR